MIKIFSSLSLKDLEKTVNQFEKTEGKDYEITNHSISHCNGEYVMSVALYEKSYH